MMKTETANDVFKPEKRGDEVTMIEFFKDNHVCVHFKRRVSDIRTSIEYVKIAKKVPKLSLYGIEGRLYFGSYGMLELVHFIALKSKGFSIHIHDKSISNGTSKTKELGLVTEFVEIGFDGKNTYIYHLPNVIENGFNHMETQEVTFEQSVDFYKYKSNPSLAKVYE